MAMNKLPTAAEVRIVAEELRLSREHFVAVEYRDDAQDMLAAIKMLLQFAELLERMKGPFWANRHDLNDDPPFTFCYSKPHEDTGYMLRCYIVEVRGSE